jgi:hypothetical protein
MSWHRFRIIPKAERDAFEKEFRKKSRFLVDESLGAEAARVLKELGWNTVYTGDVGLNGGLNRGNSDDHDKKPK